MADAVRISNLPDGGSIERVAFDLYEGLRGHLPPKHDGLSRIKQYMQLYTHCRDVVRGGDPATTGLE